MDKIKEIRHNLQKELHAFHDSKPHPYASLVPEKLSADADDFDPIVRISTHHDRHTHLKQPDLNLAEYYYESMNEADNEAEQSSAENEISMTKFTAKVIPPPPTTHLVFDHQARTDIDDIPPPIPSPPPPAVTPIEEKEVVDLNFYKVMDEADPDPKQAEVRRIIDSYKTPPPLPKRGDSIARNIEKYFNTDLIKKGEEDDEENMELIEERILDNSSPTQSVDTDDQFEDMNEEFPAPPEMPPCTPPPLSSCSPVKSPKKTSMKKYMIDETDDPFARAIAKARGGGGGASLPTKPLSARSDSVSDKICRPRQPRPKPVRKQDPNKLKFAEFFAFCEMDETRRRDALGKVIKM